MLIICGVFLASRCIDFDRFASRSIAFALCQPTQLPDPTNAPVYIRRTTKIRHQPNIHYASTHQHCREQTQRNAKHSSAASPTLSIHSFTTAGKFVCAAGCAPQTCGPSRRQRTVVGTARPASSDRNQYTHAHGHTLTRTLTCTHTHTHEHALKHTNMYSHARTHTHAHVQTAYNMRPSPCNYAENAHVNYLYAKILAHSQRQEDGRTKRTRTHSCSYTKHKTHTKWWHTLAHTHTHTHTRLPVKRNFLGCDQEVVWLLFVLCSRAC